MVVLALNPTHFHCPAASREGFEEEEGLKMSTKKQEDIPRTEKVSPDPKAKKRGSSIDTAVTVRKNLWALLL